MIDRRTFIAALALGAALVPGGAAAQPLPVLVRKDPGCGCCDAWVRHLEGAGFAPTILEEPEMAALKDRLGVPAAFRSCHTAEVAGYVMEGQVPAEALSRLLAERPPVRGLAVPGMPVGSPGMEVPGVEPSAYEVIAFGEGEPAVFMRYRGVTAIPG